MGRGRAIIMLAIWTVYADPTDYPGKFVARRFDVTKDGPVPSDNVIIVPTLGMVRHILDEMHLTRMARHPDDDPKIVECWL